MHSYGTDVLGGISIGQIPVPVEVKNHSVHVHTPWWQVLAIVVSGAAACVTLRNEFKRRSK